MSAEKTTEVVHFVGLSPLAGSGDFGCLDLVCGQRFDTYREVDAHLVSAHGMDHDEVVAHVL